MMDTRIEESSNRIVFADMAKLFAIFAITVEHLSQFLSGETFVRMFGINGLFTGWHTSIFFLMSGYFLNIDKIRASSFWPFSLNKARVLLIPAAIVFAIYCLFTFHLPGVTAIKDAICIYWFLIALFVCMIIIWVTLHVFSNVVIGFIVSFALVLLCPHSSFLQINFMYPILWMGYFFRKNNKTFLQMRSLFIVVPVFILLLIPWNASETSVYSHPFDIVLHPELKDILLYIYQIVFAFTGAYCFILFFLLQRDNRLQKWMAYFGQYTLFIYVVSITLFHVLHRSFHSFQLFSPYLEFASIAGALILVLILSYIAMLLARFRWCRLFLLGKNK